MFGYVKVNSPELKVKEYELYRGIYCGLCRAMGRCTGQCSRMTLSYDFAFLAAVRLILTDTKISFSQKRCLVHPLKKRNSMDGNDQLDYCARAAAVLEYHKIRDDIADEKGAKKLKARVALPFVKRWRKKALRAGLEELDGRIGDLLSRLSELEGQRLGSVDAPAEIFGEILGEMTAYGLEGASGRIGYRLGKCVGKWIYIADALDDMSEDEKKGRYNPVLLLYGGRQPAGEELMLISDALKAELLGAEEAVDLIDTDNVSVKNIVENILFLGMPDTADKILGKDCGCAKKGKNEKGTHNK